MSATVSKYSCLHKLHAVIRRNLSTVVFKMSRIRLYITKFGKSQSCRALPLPPENIRRNMGHISQLCELEVL